MAIWVITAIHKVYALLHWASTGATCAHFAEGGKQEQEEGGGWWGSNDAFVRQINNFRMRPHATCTQMRHFLCRLLCCTDTERERETVRERQREIDSEADSDRYWRRPLSGILSTLGQLPEGFYDSSLKMQTEKEW